MTARTELDRVMLDYFAARSTNRAPDGLLETALAGVDGTRQRPAWRTADWWLPSGRASFVPWQTRRVALVVAVGLLIAIVVGVALLGGAGHRLPPPFGLAKPGAIVMEVGGDIFVADPGGGDRTALYAGPHWDGHATFSPDGTKIAFESGQDDKSIALMVMRADGTGQTTLMSGLAEVDDVIAWSSDSRWIATAARSMDDLLPPSGSHIPGTGVRIVVGDVEHGTASFVGGPDLLGHDPRWSPDGTMLAFGRDYPCCSGPPDGLWSMRPDGSDLRELSSIPGGGAPAWSPDGRRIAFLGGGVNRDLYLINVGGNVLGQAGGFNVTQLWKVTDTPADESFPVWSPDGTRIAFPRMLNQYGTSAELEILDVTDGRKTALPSPNVTYDPPVWSPDGTHILGYVYRHPEIPGGVPAYDALAIFDVTGGTKPVDIPIAGLRDASWQRLAP
jgi:Tol biopolymer transport system component